MRATELQRAGAEQIADSATTNVAAANLNEAEIQLAEVRYSPITLPGTRTSCGNVFNETAGHLDGQRAVQLSPSRPRRIQNRVSEKEKERDSPRLSVGRVKKKKKKEKKSPRKFAGL